MPLPTSCKGIFSHELYVATSHSLTAAFHKARAMAMKRSVCPDNYDGSSCELSRLELKEGMF